MKARACGHALEISARRSLAPAGSWEPRAFREMVVVSRCARRPRRRALMPPQNKPVIHTFGLVILERRQIGKRG